MIPDLRMYLKIGAALALIGALGWFGFHERRLEHARDVAADTAAVAKEREADTARAHADAIAISQEAKSYANTVASAVVGAPVISLCVEPPRPVHAAGEAAARPEPHDAPAVRGADPVVPAVIRWDSEPVVRAGRDADAQIAQLQDYIRRVCPVP